MAKAKIPVSVDVPIAAQGNPNFVIEKDGVYYLAVAVLEYNPKLVRNDVEKEGVAQVRALYEHAVKSKPLQAGCVELFSALVGCMNTKANPDS